MTTDEFWIADAPIKYEIRKTGNDGVVVLRCEDGDENCEQAWLRIVHHGNTLHLRQVDGDLDAGVKIARDQDYLKRNAQHPLDIWRRIWKVATDRGDAFERELARVDRANSQGNYPADHPRVETDRGDT